MSEKIAKLIEEKRNREIRDILGEMNVVDIAALLEEQDSESALLLFRLLPKETAADVFAYLSAESRQSIVYALTDPELAYIINDLYTDDAVDFIEEMPASVVKRVLKIASEDTRTQINQILQYPEDSAGTIMTTEFISLKRGMTIADAFLYIRRNGMDKETIYTCYVTNDTRVLEGVVTVKMLLLSEENQTIGEIMDENVIYATTSDEREDVANKVRKYDINALPVVDHERRLVGIITVDDVIEVVEQENTEDFQIMAAMQPSDEPYMKMGVFRHARHRITWLLILMISATFTGMILSFYESAFALVPALVASIPMLMDTGGNAGSQSSTLIIRSLALGELKMSAWLTVLLKEVRIGLLVGAALAILNIIRIYILGHDILLALTVGITLWATVIFAKVIGCMLPMVAKKAGVDPAIMAAPLITTIVDACSLTIYFSLAIAIMGLIV